MITGWFDQRKRPYIRGVVLIPRFRVWQSVNFLLDTGADLTCLHSKDAKSLQIPEHALHGATNRDGVGGGADYFQENATILFADGSKSVSYNIVLNIACDPGTDRVPALLGRDIFNHWYIEYDLASRKLQCTVR